MTHSNSLTPPRRAPRAAAIAAAATAVALAAACGDQGATTLPARKEVIPDSAEQVMFGMRTYLLTNGVRRAELFADTAYTYDNANRLELRGVTLHAFTGTGDSSAVMTGRSGTYDVRQGRVEGRGDVKVVSKDGRRLTSPRLVFDRVSDRISSDTVFQFVSPGNTLSGIGFESDPGLRNVRVLSGARGSANPQRGRR